MALPEGTHFAPSSMGEQLHLVTKDGEFQDHHNDDKKKKRMSKKQRNKPQLAEGVRLHQLAPTKPTGVGLAVASLPNRILGQGKRKVWAGVKECMAARKLLKFTKLEVETNKHSSDDSILDSSNSVRDPSSKREDLVKVLPLLSQQKTTYPLLEALRASWIFKVRKQFRADCGDKPPPALALERWLQASEMLFFHRNYQKQQSTPEVNKQPQIPPYNQYRNKTQKASNPQSLQVVVTWDSIILDPSAPAALVLQADLERASISTSDAQRIICSLYGRVAVAAKEIELSQIQQQHLQPCQEQSSLSPTCNSKNVVIKVVQHSHTYDVCLAHKPKHILKINHEHYDKLKALWTLTNCKHDAGAAAAAATTITAGKSDWDRNKDEGGTINNETPQIAKFHSDLYCLLSRYFSIQGPGFQAACPEAVFEALQSSLQVHHECFASPLNCYYGSFCSAYPDVDAPFGSMGSFWDFLPTSCGGSFQANPPFLHHVMTQMVKTMETLLSWNHETVPFSFVVIVPVWLEESSYQSLQQSRFRVQHFIISKADHGYCDGAQHQRQDRFRTSPYDTAVVLLQNKAGRIKYVHPSTWEQDLRHAFATGVPTDAALQRRKRDGRGDAKEDGGGGVYKGKKRNRTGEGVKKRRWEDRCNTRSVKRSRKATMKSSRA